MCTILILLLLVLVALDLSMCSSCLYYYEVQPPDSIDCNPEGSEDLAVNCTACAVKPNNFTLGWVKQNEDLMTLLENSDKRMITNISTESSNSKGQQVQCVSSQLILVGNSTQHYGHYFCQIQDDNEGTYNHSTVLPLFPHSTCPNGNTFQSASYLCAVPLQMDGMVVPSSSITITTIVTVVTTTIVVVVSTVEAVQTPPALSSYCAGCCSMEPMASIMTDESNSAAVSAVATTLSTFFVVLIVLVLIVIGWLAVKAYLYRRNRGSRTYALPEDSLETLENQMFHNDVYGQLVMEELQKRREEARSAQDIDTDITPPTNM